MSDTRTSLLLHPVRLRVVQAALGREVTTSQLASWLPDVATATLYRHVAALVDGGVLEVVGEQPVRGATERTLRVALPAAWLGPDDITALSTRDPLDGVTAFLAGVLQSASDYLTAPGATPARDGFGYRQIAVWADDQELVTLTTALREVLFAAQERGPGPGRRRRVLTTILVPDPLPPGPHSPVGDDDADAVGSPPRLTGAGRSPRRPQAAACTPSVPAARRTSRNVTAPASREAGSGQPRTTSHTCRTPTLAVVRPPS